MKPILIQSDYKAASDNVWAREAVTMLPATSETWQLWKSCWTGVQSESTGNSRPPKVFHHHLLTPRHVNIRDVQFYLQMHSMFLFSQMKSRSIPQNSVWQYFGTTTLFDICTIFQPPTLLVLHLEMMEYFPLVVKAPLLQTEVCQEYVSTPELGIDATL